MLERKLLRSNSYKMYCANRARVRVAWLERKQEKKRAAETGATYDPHRSYGPTIEDAQTAARSANLWQSTREPVRVFAKKKKSGCRRIHNYGLERRTRDEMLRLVLKNRADLHPGQYAPSRGLKAIEDAIASAIGSGEWKVALTTDVRDCFGSIDASALPELLGLPEQVVNMNIAFDHINIDAADLRRVRREESEHELRAPEESPDEIAERLRYTGRLSVSYLYQDHPGIPQGPSSSPIIAEYVIADCLRSAPTGVLILTWVDDILILAKNRRDAERAFETLRLAFARARGGRLWLKTPKIRRVADGFDFIGFRFRHRCEQTRIEPSHDNVRGLIREMDSRLHKLAHRGLGQRNTEAYLRSWFGVFARWELADRLRSAYERRLDLAAFVYQRLYRHRTEAEAGILDRSLRRLGWTFEPPLTTAEDREPPVLYVRME